uniref:Ion transport domain-containing protein n=1 Tax=Knipowitschia caucasica TaxID=637954 RepID=A0AAV2J7U6_KNICA
MACSQSLLTQIWCGHLSVSNPLWRVLLCVFFCPLIYLHVLDFRQDELIQREADTKEEMKSLQSVTGSVPHMRSEDTLSAQNLQPLDAWTRLVSLYSSPQVKFFLNIVSYFCFLGLFSVVLMVDFQNTPSGLEILLYVWLFSLVCEELRQLTSDSDGFGFRKKAQIYINDLWNILDVLSIILFIVGLVFRLTAGLFYAGKILLCIDFIVFCLRLMAIFTISRTLGPKIIIVKRMMRDMFFFMFLLSIWVVAYGVAKQGILIHNEDRLGWILRGAVYEPYLTIFGDVPSNIDNTDFDITSCSLDGNDPHKPRCPVLTEDDLPAFPEWLTILMLCVYLLFANILLLNLLIAIFNFTFQEVQDNTDRIWKFQRYELIKEYHSRPVAPPPFILLSHLYLLLRLVLRRPAPASTAFKQELSQLEEEELLSWEALMKDRYLMSLKQQQMQSMEQRITDTALKVSSLCERQDQEEDGSSRPVVRRLVRLEEQVLQSARALQWIMDNLRPSGFRPSDAPSLNLMPEDSVDGVSNTADREEVFHVMARELQYPGSRVTRFPVPEEKVPWEVRTTLYLRRRPLGSEDHSVPDEEAPGSFSSYNPPHYSCPTTGGSTQGYVLSCTTPVPPQGAANRGMSSLLHYTCPTTGGRPQGPEEKADVHRNPGGRTGLRGRGKLPHLGPNRSMDLIITRWRDSACSELEFLVQQDRNQKCLTFPGGHVDADGRLPLSLTKTLGPKVCEKISELLSEKREVLQVYEGYVDDPQNTDQAWLETSVLNIHLHIDCPLLVDISAAVTRLHQSLLRLQWVEVSGRARLRHDQKELLKRVAQHHCSKF